MLLQWTLPPFPFPASFRVGSVLRVSKQAGLAAARSSHHNQVILHSEQLPLGYTIQEQEGVPQTEELRGAGFKGRMPSGVP